MIYYGVRTVFILIMRVIVFSDSHGNYDVLEKIMERHKDDGDVFIHLGDGEREFELLTYVYNDKKLLFVLTIPQSAALTAPFTQGSLFTWRL